MQSFSYVTNRNLELGGFYVKFADLAFANTYSASEA